MTFRRLLLYMMMALVRAEPAVTNNVCTHASTVSRDDPERTGSTWKVTVSDEGTRCGNLDGFASSRALWYVVKGTGERMTADTCSSGANFNTVTSILQGPCGGTSTCIAFNDDGCMEEDSMGSQVVWQSEPNVDYYIRIAGDHTESFGDFVFRVGLVESLPDNEDCTTAIAVSLDDPERTGSTRMVTISDDGTTCGDFGGFASSRALWYVVKGTGDRMSADTCSNATNFDTVISILQGPCVEAATCIAFNDDGCGSKSSVQWQTEPNIDYYIRVAGYHQSSIGDFVVRVGVDDGCLPDDKDCTTGPALNLKVRGSVILDDDMYQPEYDDWSTPEDDDWTTPDYDDWSTPDYDDCTNATVIILDNDDPAGSASMAIAFDYGTIDYFASSRSAWYIVKGTGNSMSADTCSYQTNFDTVIYVLQGSCDFTADVIAFNDDGCDEYYAGSKAVWHSEPGVDYYVLVAGYSAEEFGDFAFCVTDMRPPANDKCTNATAISLDDPERVGSTSTPTSFDDSIRCNDWDWFESSPALWYVVKGTGARMSADTCAYATNFDTVISILQGPCGATSTCIAVNDDGCNDGFYGGSQAVWQSELDVDYYIRIAGFHNASFGDFVVRVADLSPPENDDCTNATAVSVGDPERTGSTRTVTLSDDGTSCGHVYGFDSSRAVWYVVKGTGDWMSADTCSNGTNFDTVISILQGPCGGTSNCIAFNDEGCDDGSQMGSQAVWQTEPDVDYYIRVAGSSNESFGEFVFRVVDWFPLGNEDCTNATVVSVGDPERTGSTSMATIVDDDISCGSYHYFASSRAVWYIVRGSGNWMTAHTCSSGTNFNTVISILRGPCGGTSNCINFDAQGCFDGSFLGSQALWQSEPGVDYYIRVAGYDPESFGEFVFRVADWPIPENDDCTNATVVSVEDPELTGSTSMLLFLDDGTSCGGFDGFGSSGALWYVVRGTRDMMSASTCSNGTNFDTVLSVLQGPCGGPSECIAYDDDGCDDGSSWGSQAVWNSEPDVDYYIRVAGYDTMSIGDFAFRVLDLSPPENDDCTSATGVSLDDPERFGSTGLVSVADDGALCGGFASSRALWYVVRGTGDRMSADTCSNRTNMDTVISILQGPCGATSDCVAFNDDGCNEENPKRSRAVWQSELDVDYFIRVAGLRDSRGDFVFRVADWPPPENEACTNATAVSLDVPERFGNTMFSLPDGGTTCGELGSSRALWYTIKGTGRRMSADTCSNGTNFDTVFSVLQGSCGETSTCIAFNHDGCESKRSVIWQTEPDVDYYIRVAGRHPLSFGVFVFRVRVVGSPNEVCSKAITVTPDDPEQIGNITMDTLSDGGTSCGDLGSSRALWYTFKGTGRRMSADTCSNGTNFNTVISILTGSCGETSDCIAPHDDGCDDADSMGSRVLWQTEPNIDYYIRVAGHNNESLGKFVFRVGVVGSPNQDCTNATEVSLDDPKRTGTTTVDSLSDGGTSCGDFGSSRPLWYIVQGTGEKMSADTCSNGTNHNTVISVVTGSCGETSDCIAFSDDGCDEADSMGARVTWQTEPNVDYSIRVAGYHNESFGEFVFRVGVVDECPPEDEDCTDNAPELRLQDPERTASCADFGVFGSSRSLWRIVKGTGDTTFASLASISYYLFVV